MKYLLHLRQRFSETLRWEGPLWVLRRAAVQLLRPLITWDAFHVFQADLDVTPAPIPAREGIDLRIYHAPFHLDALRLKLSLTGAVLADQVESRLQRGDLAAVAFAGGEVAGFTWICLSPEEVRAKEPTLLLKRDEALHYHTFVIPERRGQGLHRILDSHLMRYVRDLGIARTFTVVDSRNPSSLKNQVRLGKRKVMTVVSVRLRGINQPWTVIIGGELKARLQEASVHKG
jgi:GNAT superfamily N-acetyltransferase